MALRTATMKQEPGGQISMQMRSVLIRSRVERSREVRKPLEVRVKVAAFQGPCSCVARAVTALISDSLCGAWPRVGE